MALLRRRTSTPARIAASQANGRKSRGPITPEGKANTRRNGLRHGLRCETLDPTAHCPAFRHRYQTTLAGFLAEIDPADGRRLLAAHQIALATAQLEHLARLEEETVRREIQRLAPQHPGLTPIELEAMALKNLSDASTLLERIHRHACRWDRIFFRAIAKLENPAARAKQTQKQKTKLTGQTLKLAENTHPALFEPREPETHSARPAIGIQSVGAAS